MKPTICHMCGEPFSPQATEHVCGACIAELDELEIATTIMEKEAETNEQPTHQD